ncbi:MAG: MFS transporter [Chloroflexi bacterium]|nr:MFS transporter [Chloroflexota bacterium]
MALVVASLSSFITPFLSSAVNVALPSIGREFALDAVTLGWVASSYLLAAAVFLVPFGRIGDIYGRKRVFVYGAIVNAVSSLVLALSPSAAVLISFRTLQGIGGAMGAGTSLAILTSIFPARDRGKVLGINVAFTYFGLSLGPTFGGLLTQHFGWRSIFFATVLLGIAIIVAVLWKLRGEWAEARGEDFDLVGSVVYGLALVAFMYGFTILSEARGVWVFVAGVIGMLAFVKWETMTKSPVLSISLFKDNIAFSFSNLSALINYSATFAVGFLLSLYLQYIKGFSPAHAGVVLVAQPVVMAALSPLAGRLSDKLQPRLIASLGMATTTLGLAMLVFLGPDTGLGFILASLGILGLGFAFFSSPNTNAVMSSVENRFYGVAAGTLGTMRATGQTLSLGVVMLLFAVLVGKVQITPEYYPLFLKSTRIAFITFAVLCLGGIFASLARGKTR